MLNERRRLILRSLVEEYVQSAQPVASRSLVARYDLGCSPATVRNDLAALEETGHVRQPHVSAGRVPTDLGYRAFVDSMMDDSAENPGLGTDEVEAIHQHYGRIEHEVADLMRDTSALLSRLTSYVSVVLAPAIDRARIKRVSAVRLGATRVAVVVITDTGQVVNRTAELAMPVSEDDVRDVEAHLNGALDDTYAQEVRSVRSALSADRSERAEFMREVVDVVLECLAEADEDRVYHGGASGLLSQPEFADPRMLQPLLTLLEDGVAVLQTLSSVIQCGGMVVRIGAENPEGLDRLSMVAAAYGHGGSEGIIGVIGPTRMDYPRTVASVRCVADSLSDALGD